MRTQQESPWFDDCPICQYMKQVEAGTRIFDMPSYLQASKEAEKVGGWSGTGADLDALVF